MDITKDFTTFCLYIKLADLNLWSLPHSSLKNSRLRWKQYMDFILTKSFSMKESIQFQEIYFTSLRKLRSYKNMAV
jgi:hypothetical protein